MHRNGIKNSVSAVHPWHVKIGNINQKYIFQWYNSIKNTFLQKLLLSPTAVSLSVQQQITFLIMLFTGLYTATLDSVLLMSHAFFLNLLITKNLPFFHLEDFLHIALMSMLIT